MKSYAVSPELVPLIARACHEANRAYCLSLGDQSQLPWDVAPIWQREAAAKGVLKALCGGATPRELHESWLASMASSGWVFGPVKDAEKRTHPCMLPYDQLPSEQQRKDKLFFSVCAAMAKALDLSEVQVARKDGLFEKYLVERWDGKPLKGDGALVLEFGDYKAWPAIAQFANTVESQGNSAFAEDLRRVLREQRDPPPERGSCTEPNCFFRDVGCKLGNSELNFCPRHSSYNKEGGAGGREPGGHAL